MDRILVALEALLEEKPFDRITIQELAQRSGTGTSSIYARFRDKQALVLGVHARLRETVFECLDDLTDPDRWAGESVDRLVLGTVPFCVKFYRRHGTLIRAALMVTDEDDEIRERQASVLRYAASRFSALIPVSGSRQVRARDSAVDFSVKLFVSVMYTSLLFNKIEMGRKPMSDREMARYLVRTITPLLQAVQGQQ